MEGHLNKMIEATKGVKEEYEKMKKAHEDRINNLEINQKEQKEAVEEMKQVMETQKEALAAQKEALAAQKEALEAQKKAQKEMKETLEAKINELAGNFQDYKKGISNQVFHAKVKAEGVAMHTHLVHEKIKNDPSGLDATTIGHINNGADLAKQCLEETEQLFHMARGGVVDAKDPKPSNSGR